MQARCTSRTAAALAGAWLLAGAGGCCHGLRGDIALSLGSNTPGACCAAGCGGHGCAHGDPAPGHGGLLAHHGKFKPAPRPTFQGVPLGPVFGPAPGQHGPHEVFDQSSAPHLAPTRDTSRDVWINPPAAAPEELPPPQQQPPAASPPSDGWHAPNSAETAPIRFRGGGR